MMEEVSFYVDVKETIWCREHFTTTKENMEKIKNAVEADNYDPWEDKSLVQPYEREHIFETSESMTIGENGGCSTLEMYDDDGELVCKNAQDV